METELKKALADYYLKLGQQDQAESLAPKTLRRFPGHAAVKELLRYLKR